MCKVYIILYFAPIPRRVFFVSAFKIYLYQTFSPSFSNQNRMLMFSLEMEGSCSFSQIFYFCLLKNKKFIEKLFDSMNLYRKRRILCLYRQVTLCGLWTYSCWWWTLSSEVSELYQIWTQQQKQQGELKTRRVCSGDSRHYLCFTLKYGSNFAHFTETFLTIMVWKK